MLKKINSIFKPKGIFDFSYLQFDTISVKYNGSDMEGKKNFGAVSIRDLQGSVTIHLWVMDLALSHEQGLGEM
jgi:hypothetical protein